MKRLLYIAIIAVSFAINARGTAHSCAASNTVGNWNVAGSWNPASVPVSGDAVTIANTCAITVSDAEAADTVTLTSTAATALTVANGGALTVGAATAGTVVTLTNAHLLVQQGGTLTFGNQPATAATGMSFTGTGSLLEISGTVVAQNNIVSTAGHPTGIHIHAYGQLQFNSTATNGPYLINFTQGSGAPWVEIVIDGSNWGNGAVCGTDPIGCITTIGAGAGTKNWTIAAPTNPEHLVVTYGKLLNCGVAGTAVDNVSYLVLSHVVLNCLGIVQWKARDTTSDGDTLSWDNVALIYPTGGAGGNAVLINGGGFAANGNLRQITNSTFNADGVSAGNTVIENTDDLTLTNIFSTSYTNAIFNASVQSRLHLNNAIFGRNNTTDVSFTYFNDTAMSCNVWDGGGVWMQSDGSHNTRAYTSSNTTPNTCGPNEWKNFVVDANNASNFDAFDPVYRPSASSYAHNFIATGNFGIFYDTVAPNLNSENLASHFIMHSPGTSGHAGYGVMMYENSPSAFKHAALKFGILDKAYTAISIGVTATSYVPQTSGECTLTGVTVTSASNVSTLAATLSGCTGDAITTNTPFTFDNDVATATWLRGQTFNYVTATDGSTTVTASFPSAMYPAIPTSYSTTPDSGSVHVGFYYDYMVNTNQQTQSNPLNAWNPAVGHASAYFVADNGNTLPAAFTSMASTSVVGTSTPTSSVVAGNVSATVHINDNVRCSGDTTNTAPVTALSFNGGLNRTTITYDSPSAKFGSLATNGLVAATCTGGTIAAIYRFWNSRAFGAAGAGQHSIYTFPDTLRCSSCNVASWDLSLGGAGTMANARDQMLKMANFDKTGTYVATPSALYTIPNFMNYMESAFTSMGVHLTHAANDGSDLTWVGLVYNGSIN